MNAPVITLAIQASPRGSAERGATMEGAARHVSTEGCQFVVQGARPTSGQKLGCIFEGEIMSGTVRWVLEDRIGFAFDRRIDLETCTRMAGQSVALRALSDGAAPAPG